LTRILVLCHATVGSQMASPGIRSFNIARVLRKQLPDAEVTLAVPAGSPSDLDPATVDFDVARFDASSLPALARAHDVIISTRFPLKMLPFAGGKRLVLDLYTPFITEWIEMTKDDPGKAHRRAWLETKRKDLLTQLALADVVLCANVRQRDLLAGIMSTAGMIPTRAYDENPTLERLIRIAPLGVRAAEPEQRRRILRGVRPGIGDDDFIMIWNGIIVEWYDLDLLLRAVHRVSQRHANVRLFFMGTEHPDSHGSKPLMGLGGGATRAAIRLSEELGLLDKNVFFNFTWASNDETQQYLLESDIGVCTYFDSLETRYSFRVRYLDLFWAELPVVCTRGDVVSEMVEKRRLGVAVPEGDLDALTAAIEKLVCDGEFRAECKRNLHGVREEYTWERTLEPLVEFCADPDSNLTRRGEQALPAATRALDWLGSRVYYGLRFGIRTKIRDLRKAREG
jgi:glycosyltransferase involved in cell wall biosynthesis